LIYRARTALRGRLSVNNICQLLGQNGNRTSDVVPASTHCSRGDWICEMRRIPNLISLQYGIDAAVEAQDCAFEPADQLLNPSCRDFLVRNLALLACFTLIDALAKACADARWMISAYRLCSPEIVLLHGVLPRSGTSTDGISKFRPSARKKLAKGPGYRWHLRWSRLSAEPVNFPTVR
jgi:hypothetical protein